MAEQITLKKRLIGKEDINFDITGTGEQEYFFTADGGKKTVSKINASHLPLTADTREEVAAVNVDEAVSLLNRKVEGFSANDSLESDLEIIFENEDDFEAIQNKINQQKKNLGGHTLRFIFPASLSQNLYSTLEWRDFYNGTLIITGGSENSPVAIYDRQDIDSLFRIYRCQCEVQISNFYFVHQYSMYGVAVESSSATVIRDCNFSGIADEDSYAIYSLVSNVSLINCQFTDESETEKDDNDVTPSNSGMGKSIGEIFAYPAALPPEGAYLLNGQTIANCESLYPKFWQWLTENAGEMVETPVYKPWTMPSLSADGTVGGADYAVEASSACNSGFEAYKSFDGVPGGSKTYAGMPNVTDGWLTFYSPVKVKLNSVLFKKQTNAVAGNMPSSIVIWGSNDNSAWVELAWSGYAGQSAGDTQTLEIPASNFNVETPGYQYLKIEAVNSGGSNMDFPEITLYGQEYLYTDHAGNGNILTMSQDAYEYTLARTGVCGGFVIDSRAGSVRLPTVVNGTLWGADSSTIGQSLAAGLPKIEGEYIHSSAYKLSSITGAFSREDYASNLSGDSSGGSTDNKIIFDASKSNDIYGNSDTVQPPAIRVSWCIQVFNAATTLSEQESAQFASEMQTKMQTDLGNASKASLSAIDTVMPDSVDYIIEHWEDGAGNWYKKFRSGWVEQGGVTPSIESNATLTVTLYIEMRDVEFSTIVTNGAGASVNDNWDYGAIGGYAKSTTTILVDRARGAGKAYWRVAGMAAN